MCESSKVYCSDRRHERVLRPSIGGVGGEVGCGSGKDVKGLRSIMAKRI